MTCELDVSNPGLPSLIALRLGGHDEHNFLGRPNPR